MFLFSYCSFKSELECFGIILQALPFDMISVEKMRTFLDQIAESALSDPQLIFDDVFSVEVKKVEGYIRYRVHAPSSLDSLRIFYAKAVLYPPKVGTTFLPNH